MSSSGQCTHLKLLTVGDFDPQTDCAIEHDFTGRVIAGRYTIRARSRTRSSHARAALVSGAAEPYDGQPVNGR